MKENTMTLGRTKLVVLAVAAALGVAACGSSSSSSSSTGSSAGAGASSSGSSSTSSTASSGGGAADGAKSLTGAGSTLVAPLESYWAPAYQSAKGVSITYGAIGSGGGIKQISARTVDFGASDAPLTASQAAACNSCVEIPWALASTVIAYHVQGVPNNLKLTGPVLASIYMGKIKTWNDPAIKALNPGVNLPSTPIVPVHRTDGSGDTFALTNYLSKVSPQFKSSIGNATLVSFPGGLGGKGNSGVGGVLSSTNGAIAYIAIAYVLQNKFDYALIQNAAGKYPTPSVASESAAAAALTSVPSGGTQGISLTDPPASAPNAYPISTFTYVIAPKQSKSPSVATALSAFINWAVTTGQQYGPKLDFAPLPSAVVSADQADAALLK
jgi:phosphate transport system substrate-binding protein